MQRADNLVFTFLFLKLSIVYLREELMIACLNAPASRDPVFFNDLGPGIFGDGRANMYREGVKSIPDLMMVLITASEHQVFLALRDLFAFVPVQETNPWKAHLRGNRFMPEISAQKAWRGFAHDSRKEDSRRFEWHFGIFATIARIPEQGGPRAEIQLRTLRVNREGR
jgi:hypothetical protein